MIFQDIDLDGFGCLGPQSNIRLHTPAGTGCILVRWFGRGEDFDHHVGVLAASVVQFVLITNDGELLLE